MDVIRANVKLQNQGQNQQIVTEHREAMLKKMGAVSAEAMERRAKIATAL